MSLGRPLGALAHEQFRLLFGGLVASNVGYWMHQFAVGWLVTQLAIRDGDSDLVGFYLGLTGLVSALPSLISGLVAGVCADRFERRGLLMSARIVSAIIAVVLAVDVLIDAANIFVVMALVAASSAAFAFDPPGRQAIIQNVVSIRDLFSAIGLTRASMQVAHTLGPLIAGVLVTPIGIGGVFIVKALLDAASTAALSLMRPQPVAHGMHSSSLLSSLREGLAHVRRDEVIRDCVILQIVFALFAQSYMQLLPALAVDTLHVGAVELSWLIGAVGVGAIVGAVIVAGSGGVERRGVFMLMAMGSAGALLILLGMQRSLLAALLILACMGLVQQLFMGTQTVILQLAAPERLRGRVVGIQSVVFVAVTPLGVFAVGSVVTLLGISTAFLLAGAMVVGAVVLSAARAGTVRDLRTSRYLAHDVLAVPVGAPPPG